MLTKFDLAGTIAAQAEGLRLANVIRVISRTGTLEANFRAAIGGTTTVGLERSMALLDDKAKLVHTADQLYLTMVRAAVTVSLDLTRDYCKTSDQTTLLKSQPWFHLFRLFRNALNHNFRFDLQPHDLKLLPLSWNGLTIEAGLNSHELTQSHLPPNSAIDWLSDLDAFISAQLR